MSNRLLFLLLVTVFGWHEASGQFSGRDSGFSDRDSGFSTSGVRSGTSRFSSQNSSNDDSNPLGPRRASQDSQDTADNRVDNDPFGGRLIDPRLGEVVDREESRFQRIFGINGGVAESEEATSQETPRLELGGAPVKPSVRRRAWRSRAQYINRIDASLRARQSMAGMTGQPSVLKSVRSSLTSLTNGKVQAVWDADVLVIQGVVESDYRKKMVERFVLLEPGVRNIRNEIVVAEVIAPVQVDRQR